MPTNFFVFLRVDFGLIKVILIVYKIDLQQDAIGNVRQKMTLTYIPLKDNQ